MTDKNKSKDIVFLGFSESARSRIKEALDGNDEKTELRISARPAGPERFSYNMKLIGSNERTAEDIVVKSGNIVVCMDPYSAESLDGASIDFVNNEGESGFKFDNPNRPRDASHSSELAGSIEEKVMHIIESELNPALASHGGWINLDKVEDNKVYVTLAGGCQGCGMANVTIKNGVEARLRELIPEIEEVIDVTDHGSGSNPRY
ncbi:MAG: iron-sulfur cluster assembly accessory protein [Candidatus Atribacteria bacterium]|nr:MAG: iron-sulfur cluster assembly accessory protein [Candidatus Atribacteria bacterium]